MRSSWPKMDPVSQRGPRAFLGSGDDDGIPFAADGAVGGDDLHGLWDGGAAVADAGGQFLFGDVG